MQTLTPKSLTLLQIEQIEKIAQTYHETPHKLMQILIEVQKITESSLPEEAIKIVSKVTGVPVATLYGNTTFYSMLSATPRGKYVVRMCESAPCHISGAKAVMEAITRTLGITPGQTSKDGLFTLEFCQCLGLCIDSPAIMINDQVYKNLTPGRVTTIIEDYMRGDI